MGWSPSEESDRVQDQETEKAAKIHNGYTAIDRWTAEGRNEEVIYYAGTSDGISDHNIQMIEENPIQQVF
jgi:hypothetical protein